MKNGWIDDLKKNFTKEPSHKGRRITILRARSIDGSITNCMLLSVKNI